MCRTADDGLKREIKELLIASLNLPDIAPGDIADNASLFDPQGPFQLDSVDVLEVVVAVQRKYGIRIADKAMGQTVLRSVDSLADFIAREREAGTPAGQAVSL